jgi:spore maturation protein CgeB
VRIVMFCHSLLSDWNHGNAHFLRGVVSELASRGHDVRVFEPKDAWSAENLVRDHGDGALFAAMRVYPHVRPTRYDLATLDLDAALDGADVVIVHEWNAPELVRRIGAHGRSRARYKLFFHDTHHRSVTDAAAMSAYDLSAYDAVLAFGGAVQRVYERAGWARRAFVWHEAADVRVFCPVAAPREGDLVWIGNWGDDERTRELTEFLLEPARDLELLARVHGVRYPSFALDRLRAHGVEYAGYVPNFNVPDTFARFAMTVHVPRRPYVEALPGIPTIRVFEALACGIPLVSTPWRDDEGLFSPGDFLVARSGEEMRRHMWTLLNDDDARAELAVRGIAAIHDRHTCAHRVDELFGFVRALGVRTAESQQGIAPS